MDIETGDKTFDERKQRFEYVMGRLAEKPKPTLDQIGKELGISRQNVWRIKDRGVVRPSGRPRSDAARRRKLITRLSLWQERRIERLAAGQPTDREDRWIEILTGQIKALG